MPMRAGPPEPRFWSKVDKAGPVPAHCPELGPCWVWTAGRKPNGYGDFGLPKKGGHGVYAHRYSWELHYGHPGAMLVLHKCDNRQCVNPNHLFLGTRAENMADMNRKGRRALGERSPHARLTEKDVIEIRYLRAGGLGLDELAERFKVNRSHVHAVATGKRWGHV